MNRKMRLIAFILAFVTTVASLIIVTVAFGQLNNFEITMIFIAMPSNLGATLYFANKVFIQNKSTILFK